MVRDKAKLSPPASVRKLLYTLGELDLKKARYLNYYVLTWSYVYSYIERFHDKKPKKTKRSWLVW